MRGDFEKGVRCGFDGAIGIMEKSKVDNKRTSHGKSTAKIAGLKSTFTLTNDELLMTSFGRGNDAVIEKRVHTDSIEDIVDKPAFTLGKDSQGAISYQINGRNRSIGHTDNPFHRKSLGVDLTAKEDMIHAKTALENRYYGKSFSDNIHIQAIYNVLDIEKILAIHSNNIIYTLNNFLRTEGVDLTDFVGELKRSVSFSALVNGAEDSPTRAERKRNFERLCYAKRLTYLNVGIDNPLNQQGQVSNAAHKFTPEEFYYVLIALSDLRNMLAHGDHKQNIYKWSSAADLRGADGQISAVLDKLYSNAVDKLNRDFLNHSKSNLHILAEVMMASNLEKRQELVNRYYEFEVTKVYKNLGFSIKRLRELFIGNPQQAARLGDIEYDTVRAKLYRFIDFIVYDYCLKHPEFGLAIVEQLRACKDEEAKDSVYRDSAEQLWPIVGRQIMQLGDLCRGEIFAKLKSQPDDSLWAGIDLCRVQISTQASWFTKYIYMMTCFLDGKEINDLLTTLINKFENIDSFYNVMVGVNLDCNMQEPFSLFNQSDTIAKELRVINSIARMRKPSADAKRVMFIEALQVLGLSDKDDAFALAEDILTNEIRPGKKDTGLRNFIANNVIESKRFHYLVRYANPKKVKALINSRGVVAFILKDIPDSQILRYYNNVINGEETDVNKMRESIAEVLHGFTFESIKGVKQSDANATVAEKEEKNKLRALVSLYLTVLYLAVKNLVYVNSRYFLAFHCVERDRVLLDPGKWDHRNARKDENKYRPEYGWAAFSEWFLEKYPPKKRVGAYLSKNMEKRSDWAINAVRNKVNHLDAVRNADLYLAEFPKDWEVKSWYDLYHYILQRNIQDQYEYDTSHESTKFAGQMIKEPGKDDALLQEYFALLNKFHSPVKDFIKELNVPFAYNLSRYKNLSIGDLFDKNRPVEKAEKLEA